MSDRRRAVAGDPGRRCTGERGTVLAMLPAAVLVLFILAAIATDNALVLVAHREVFHAAEAGANDAAVVGLNFEGTRAGQAPPALEQRRVHRIVETILSTQDARNGTYEITGFTATPGPGGAVTVTVTAEVPHLFTGIVPGMSRTKTIKVTAVAEGRSDRALDDA